MKKNIKIKAGDVVWLKDFGGFRKVARINKLGLPVIKSEIRGGNFYVELKEISNVYRKITN
jgi:hypothetical protein